MVHPHHGESEALPSVVPRRFVERVRLVSGYLFKGLALTLLLFALQHALWNTAPFEQLQRTGYHLIQQRLAAGVEEPLPITVVDISDLETTRKSGSNRQELSALIDAIAGQGASAIGVDIDFAPDANGWIDAENDPWFFTHCLELNQKAHGHGAASSQVFLGVSRTQTLPPEKWLGAEEYESLAAGLFVPREDPRKMLEYVQVSTPAKALHSMSYRLAEAYGLETSRPWWTRRLEGWAIEPVAEKALKKEKLSYGEFWVDYSPANAIGHDHLPYGAVIKASADFHDRLAGKMVLIGDVKDATDNFIVDGQSVPGTLIHAAAAYTLVQSAPIYDITLLGDLCFDLALALLVFTAVGAVWCANPGANVAVHRVQIAATLLVVGLALVGGVYFAASTRLMWEGFIIVLLALALHGQAESFIERLKGWMISGWRRLVFEKAQDSGPS